MRRRTITWLSMAAAVVWVCAYAALRLSQSNLADLPDGPPVVVSYETTRLTEPLRADGTVDYAAALDAQFSEGVTADNNAAALFVKAMGAEALPDEEPARRATLEALGVDMPQEADTFVTSQSYRRDHPDKTDFYDRHRMAQSEHWRDEDAPGVAEWLDMNADTMAMIEQAAHRPHVYWPMNAAAPDAPEANSLMDVLNMKQSASVREAARAFACRANRRAGRGEIELAFSDILTIQRLGGMKSKGPFVIDQLVAIAIWELGANTAAELVERSDLSKEQATELLRRWRALPPLPAIGPCVDRGERYFLLDALRSPASRREALDSLVLINGLKWGESDNDALLNHLLRMTDWNVVFRKINQEYDLLVEDVQATPLARAKAFARNVKTNQDFLAKADDLPSSLGLTQEKATEWTTAVFSAIRGSSPLRLTANFADRTKTRHRLVSVALALAAYECENGHFPKNIDELVPDYLDEVGDDPFSGQPYLYERTDDGYLIYSVGMDLEDNGGDEDADIVIRRGQRDSGNGD